MAAGLGFASTADWLSRSGHVDRGTARRQVATATSMTVLPSTAAQFDHGEISATHAEEIASAMAKIDAACPNLPEVGREEAETRLVEVARAGTPSQVREVGRELLLRLHPDQKAAAEDPTANRLDYQLGRDGRGHIRADLDPVNFEEFCALITPGAKPRPPKTAPPTRARRRCATPTRSPTS